MRVSGAVERFAWRMWRGDAGALGAVTSVLLLPLEGVWRMATRLRNRRLDRGVVSGVEGLAVISVGNVAVGGTGKTPVSAWIVRVLREAGHRPALLLRGYGDDEAALHRAWNPDVAVEVAARRADAAEAARAAGADVAVLDDGFQHRSLGRILDVVLLACEDPVPGAVLPRGPYREPLSALRRADVVIVTRRHAPPSEAEARVQSLQERHLLSAAVTTAGARLAPDHAVPLSDWAEDPAAKEAPAWDASQGVVALTAIARPEAFQTDVAELTGAPTELVAFPDHHPFSSHDARAARKAAAGRALFVTEKDAVKLVDHREELGEAWVVIQRLAWDWGEADVRTRLRAVLGGSEGTAP